MKRWVTVIALVSAVAAAAAQGTPSYMPRSGGAFTGEVTLEWPSVGVAGFKTYTGSGAPTDPCSQTSYNGVIETNATLNAYQCTAATGAWQWNLLGGSGGTGGSGVQYNPAATSYIVASSSILYDDGDTHSTALPAVSSFSCTGTAPTTCTMVFATAHGLKVAGAVDVHGLTGWPAPPYGGAQEAQRGSFQVTTVPNPTTITFQTPTALTYSCTSCTGTAYDASWWAIWLLAKEPFIYGHGTVYGIETDAGTFSTSFATATAGMAGTPTYLILQVGQNDFAGGASVATVQGYLQSIWQQAHAEATPWIVVQSTMMPASYGITGVGMNGANLNLWEWGQAQTAGLTATGQFPDWYSDTATALLNGNLSVGKMPNQNANKIFADTLEKTMVMQGSDYVAPPLWGNYSNSGLAQDFTAYITATPVGFFDHTGTREWMAWSEGSPGIALFANNSGPTMQEFYAGMSAGSTWCGHEIGQADRIADAQLQCFHFVADESPQNYGSVAMPGGTDAARWFVDGHIFFPGFAEYSTSTALASAATIAPVSQVFHVTGTAAIATITAPTACTNTGQMCAVTLIPDGAWTLTTAGNIAVAGTATVGVPISLTYDPTLSKWYPALGGSGGGGGSGTVNSGSGYALAVYGSAPSTTVGPAVLSTDSTGQNINVPGKGTFGSGSPTVLNVTGQTVAALPSTGNTTGDQRLVTDAAALGSCATGGGTISLWCEWNGTSWVPSLNTGSMVYPGAGIPVSTGTAWGSSLVAPSGTIVGTTDVQTVTNKSIAASEVNSGTLAAAQMPALTGDCTTTAGTVATNCAHTFATLTDASPIAWATTGAISNATVTVAHTTATRAINLTGLAAGDYGTLIVKQDATGGAYLTGGTGCTWYVGGSSGYTASTTFFASAPAANQIDIITFVYDGTNCYANVR